MATDRPRKVHILSLFQTRLLALSLTTALAAVPAFGRAAPAEPPQPQPLALPASVPAPRDVPFDGTIRLNVDATDLARHIFTVRETVPVPAALAATGGDLTLLYPMWLPGNHSPTGPIDQFGGLAVQAGGAPVEWTRDTVTVSAFHLKVPKGAHALDVRFQLLSPVSPEEGRVVMTPDMLNVQWNALALYPAGYFTRQIMVQADLRLPAGWQYGTALRTHGATGGAVVAFDAVPFNTLVDSPLFAGRYFRRIDLAPGAAVPVTLNLVADKPAELAATDAQIKAHQALVTQAGLLYGAHHYDHYDFLLALTNELGRIGLEHHRSSENSGPRGYFTDWDKTFAARDLLAHEYTHSWNGKYRRPADLWAPDFNTPQRGSGLWVYEGQTQYWGYVLAARSGLMTAPQVVDALAGVAATYDMRQGRTWRPLRDTTNDPVIARRSPLSWRSWQRSEDYYSEGQLVWLDADTLIRKLSGDTRSLDDFARHFFGTDDGSFVTRTYGFDDVVHALNDVQPYDWAAFLHQRLDRTSTHAPLDGFTRAGYRLVYTDKPNDYLTSYAAIRHVTDFSFSLGFMLGKSGSVANVEWGSPAWQAGMTRDQQLVAVNGEAYDPDVLKDAIVAAQASNAAPLTLLMRAGDRYLTLSILYHAGLRYPHLERVAGTPDMLAAILTPRH
ncbi:M61 family metallopeptidase [Gluconacetobacter azotocaptans]|uniref:M61 family metallopeptidase n=1 Tax=Gluconacetobacter azotocaptans TaxID=142834 RepID=A0A7W4JPR8_9PROT|nr:M61 family metallopeptidase [Gluconacetobacter azotocaptans]